MKGFLQESQESKSVSAAKKLLVAKLNCSLDQADSIIRNDLRGDLTALKSKEGGKFILGCTRLFLDKQLSDAAKIDDLNETLKIIVADKSLYEKFDRDLNGLSLQELVRQFEQVRKDRLEQDKKSSESQKKTTSEKYRIELIPTFEKAKEFHKYTEWCITYLSNQWNGYTAGGYNTVYFCIRKDIDSIKEPEEGESLDYWDLSLISVIVGPDGALRYCTGRYNHKYASDADHILSTKQLESLLGVNFYKTFKPKKVEDRFKQAARAFLESNKDPRSLRAFFAGVKEPNTNKTIIPVKIADGISNYFLPDKASLLLKENVTVVNSFAEGLSVYLTNGDDDDEADYGNLNAIREDGTRLLSEDLDDVELPLSTRFHNKKLVVIQNGSWFYLTAEGRAIEIDLDDDEGRYVDSIKPSNSYGVSVVRARKPRGPVESCLVDKDGFRCSKFFETIHDYGNFYTGYTGQQEGSSSTFILDAKTGDIINSDPYLSFSRLHFSNGIYYFAVLENREVALIKIEKEGGRVKYKQLPPISVADFRKMNEGHNEGTVKVSFDYCDLTIDTLTDTEHCTGEVPAPWFSIT